MVSFYELNKIIHNNKTYNYSVQESVLDIINLGYELANTPRKEIEERMRIGEKTHYYYPDRDVFISKFGWSIPCKEALDAIKKYIREPLYDVMAGTGFWAKILNMAGIETIAHDIQINTKKNHYHKLQGNKGMPHIKLKRKNALRTGYDMSIGRIKGDVFLSWPPYECPVASELLSMLKIGTRVVYIGEDIGGCTGDLSFFTNLKNNFKLLEKVYLPNFPGIHDDMYIYEKTKNELIDNKLKGKAFDWQLDDQKEQ